MPGRARARRDPRLRPEPHRPGHRVRLLLRARGDDRARAGLRRGDGQLQPGDGLDRLRHLRPPLLRAADRRGRARRGRGRAARGRDRPVRRPDAAASSPRALARGRRAAARHAAGAIDLAEDRGRFGALLDGSASSARRTAPRRRPRRPSRSADEIGFPLLVRPSYVLGGRAMEIVYSTDELARYLERAVQREPRRTRCCSTASSRTRSRSTSTRSATATRSTSAASCSTSRRPASTPATRPACSRRSALGEEMLEEIRRQTRQLALALGVAA